jgi:hypothetical protein
MILRRVIAHVRKQEWAAIGIDFVIVVVGVFIGLQVSNWNDARAARQRGIEFTERLRADLRTEAWFLRNFEEYYDDVLDNAERALAMLEGRAPASDEGLIVSAYRATQYAAAPRARSTYDEIISTGAIGLISDQALRETANLVYTTPLFDDIAREGIASSYRERFRMIMPSETQAVLAATCGDRFVIVGDYEGIVDSLDYACETGLSLADLRAAAEALRSDAMLVPALRLHISETRSRLASVKNLGVRFPRVQRTLLEFGPSR